MKTKTKSITAENAKPLDTELPLSTEQIYKLVSITMAVQGELRTYSDEEIVGRGQAAYDAACTRGYPEAEEIAQAIIKESKKRVYQRGAKKWVKEQFKSSK